MFFTDYNRINPIQAYTYCTLVTSTLTQEIRAVPRYIFKHKNELLTGAITAITLRILTQFNTILAQRTIIGRIFPPFGEIFVDTLSISTVALFLTKAIRKNNKPILIGSMAGTAAIISGLCFGSKLGPQAGMIGTLLIRIIIAIANKGSIGSIKGFGITDTISLTGTLWLIYRTAKRIFQTLYRTAMTNLRYQRLVTSHYVELANNATAAVNNTIQNFYNSTAHNDSKSAGLYALFYQFEIISEDISRDRAIKESHKFDRARENVLQIEKIGDGVLAGACFSIVILLFEIILGFCDAIDKESLKRAKAKAKKLPIKIPPNDQNLYFFGAILVNYMKENLKIAAIQDPEIKSQKDFLEAIHNVWPQTTILTIQMLTEELIRYCNEITDKNIPIFLWNCLTQKIQQQPTLLSELKTLHKSFKKTI